MRRARDHRSAPCGWRVVTVFVVALMFSAALSSCATSGAKGAAPATLSVSGTGWWRNRELSASLERLLGDERGEIAMFNRGGTIAELKARCKEETSFDAPRDPVFVRRAGLALGA